MVDFYLDYVLVFFIIAIGSYGFFVVGILSIMLFLPSFQSFLNWLSLFAANHNTRIYIKILI